MKIKNALPRKLLGTLDHEESLLGALFGKRLFIALNHAAANELFPRPDNFVESKPSWVSTADSLFAIVVGFRNFSKSVSFAPSENASLDLINLMRLGR